MKNTNLTLSLALCMSVSLGIFSAADIGAVEPEAKSYEESLPLENEIDTPDALLRHREGVVDTNSKAAETLKRPDADLTKKDNLEKAISSDVDVGQVESAKELPRKRLGDIFQLEKGDKQDEQLTPDPLLDDL